MDGNLRRSFSIISFREFADAGDFQGSTNSIRGHPIHQCPIFFVIGNTILSVDTTLDSDKVDNRTSHPSATKLSDNQSQLYATENLNYRALFVGYFGLINHNDHADSQALYRSSPPSSPSLSTVMAELPRWPSNR